MTPNRCHRCNHVDGDPTCAHDIVWADEIKITNPAYRRRSCKKCGLSECIQVCGPNDDRAYPCGKKDCRYCGRKQTRHVRGKPFDATKWKSIETIGPAIYHKSALDPKMFQKPEG